MENDTDNQLRIAAIFSMTGRESEIEYSENPTRYNDYRTACSQNFVNYVQEEMPAPFSKSDNVERMADVIRYRGNPKYPTSINKAGPERNYLHWILSMAHKLDLPRCYRKERYQKEVAAYDKLVEESPEQQAALKSLQQYAMNLINEHGDRLFCKFDEQGKLVDDAKDYEPHFAKVSTSPNAAFSKTATVTPPQSPKPPSRATRQPS